MKFYTCRRFASIALFHPQISARGKVHCRYFATRDGNGGSNGSKGPLTKDKTFDELFSNAHSVQRQKISEEGTFDALYQECMADIYRKRAEIQGHTEATRESPEIQELTQKELEITRAVFKRTNPCEKFLPKLDRKEDFIDPYWDPFKKLDRLKVQVAAEFNDLARLISAADARKQRKLIKEASQTFEELSNPYTKRGEGLETSDPMPSDVNEKFWDPDVDKRLVLQNNKRSFSFRDLHVLHNFVAENGQILPRRLTCATRQQQRQIFKAIRTARQMALFPYDWKPRYRDRIPLMDPKQYFVEELFHRYSKLGDLRAKAMIHIMMMKNPHLNCFRFLKYESDRFKSGLPFKDTLDKYKDQ